MDTKKIEQTLKNKRITKIIFLSLAFIVVFMAGTHFGYDRAVFSSRVGENYYRMFDSNGPSMMNGLGGRDLPPGGHGAIGKIVRISLPTFVVAETRGGEQLVRIDTDTMIRRFRDNVTSADLKVGDMIVILGTPNDSGEVLAKLIRIMPPLEGFVGSTTNSMMRLNQY